MNPFTLGSVVTAMPPAAPVIEFSTAVLLVMAVLMGLLLKAFTGLRREVDALRALVQPRTAVPAPPEPAVSPATVPPEVRAVIAAAIAMALQGTPARVVRVVPVTSSTGWSLEGRRDHFGSHRLR